MECSDEVLRHRLMSRAKDSGRDDDIPESIERRIQMFRDEQSKVTKLLPDELVRKVGLSHFFLPRHC